MFRRMWDAYELVSFSQYIFLNGLSVGFPLWAVLEKSQRSGIVTNFLVNTDENESYADRF